MQYHDQVANMIGDVRRSCETRQPGIESENDLLSQKGISEEAAHYDCNHVTARLCILYVE